MHVVPTYVLLCNYPCVMQTYEKIINNPEILLLTVVMCNHFTSHAQLIS